MDHRHALNLPLTQSMQSMQSIPGRFSALLRPPSGPYGAPRTWSTESCGDQEQQTHKIPQINTNKPNKPLESSKHFNILTQINTDPSFLHLSTHLHTFKSANPNPSDLWKAPRVESTSSRRQRLGLHSCCCHFMCYSNGFSRSFSTFDTLTYVFIYIYIQIIYTHTHFSHVCFLCVAYCLAPQELRRAAGLSTRRWSV